MGRSKEMEAILKLLEEGKINSAQAKDLIDALSKVDEEKDQEEEQEASNSFSDTIQDDEYDHNNAAESKEFNDFENFERKFSGFGMELGQNIKNAVFDKLSDIKKDVFDSFSLDMPNDPSINGMESKTMEFELQSNSTISVEGKNSSVNFRRSPNDKVIVSISIKPKDFSRLNGLVEIEYTNENLNISLDEIYKDKIVIAILLPDILFKKINVETTNGPITCQDVKCEIIWFEGTNGSINLKRCIGKSFKAATSNGSVKTEQNNFDESILIESSNGALMTNMDYSKRIEMETTNGAIKMIRSSARSFRAETTNGSVLFDFLKPCKSEGRFIMTGETTNGSVIAKINRNFGAVFECASGRSGNIVLGRNFNTHSIQRNNLGRISYAKGESRFAYKSDIVAAVDAKTSNGTVTLEFI